MLNELPKDPTLLAAYQEFEDANKKRGDHTLEGLTEEAVQYLARDQRLRRLLWGVRGFLPAWGLSRRKKMADERYLRYSEAHQSFEDLFISTPELYKGDVEYSSDILQEDLFTVTFDIDTGQRRIGVWIISPGLMAKKGDDSEVLIEIISRGKPPTIHLPDDHEIPVSLNAVTESGINFRQYGHWKPETTDSPQYIRPFSPGAMYIGGEGVKWFGAVSLPPTLNWYAWTVVYEGLTTFSVELLKTVEFQEDPNVSAR